ncbi:Pullulanase, type I, partial [human gut metagenome]
DPLNYNVPEGSYATDPYDGMVRIKEFKEMILALHNAGIRVVMDVVYNHTYSLDSWSTIH